MDKSTVLRPHLSEKAYGQSQALNVYVFKVPADASKQMVASAIKAQFEVTVKKVAISNLKGKQKRTIRRRGRVSTGKRVDVKKAYVTLKEGDSIPVFAAVEEAQAKSEKLEKAAEKAATKAAKKGDK